MDILTLDDLPDRNSLGRFLVARGLVGYGAEIGTHLAEFAVTVLKHWPGKLLCVDPWQNNMPGYHDRVAYRDRNADYKTAMGRLAPYADRVSVLRDTSANAVSAVADGLLDWAYIDANHLPPHITNDMEMWWAKVKPGGILAGHDLTCWEWEPYVRPAVLAFAEKYSVQPYRTQEDADQSWLFFKPLAS